MSDDPLLKKFKEEIQPELDRVLADHKRRRRQVARLLEPSDARRKSGAEADDFFARLQSPPSGGDTDFWVVAGAILAFALFSLLLLQAFSKN